MELQQQQQQTKLIFSPMLAKFLLTRNFQIVDLKKDRRDTNNTIYVFRLDDGLTEAIYDYKSTKQ